ncbi:DUF2400 domain-containing protein [Myxococcota bacterium]|nr:DUF2400 domain-containing protein [Myxococcota bacterium]
MPALPPPAPLSGSPARLRRVRTAMEELGAQLDPAERLGQDPLAFARAWADPADQEAAAVLCSGLSYGRVAAFWPVLRTLMGRAAERGGPAAWLHAFDRDDARVVEGLRYRFMEGADIATWCGALGAALRQHGRLGALVEAGHRPEHADVGPALDHLVTTLRALALAESHRQGRGRATRFSELPAGLRYFLPRPADGSACKRWCMALRWLVRRPGDPRRVDGLDLGLWALPPAKLVVPLDTHVARLSWFLGLTDRRDGSWRTAQEITAGLARLDPADPLRFDFALAHLGISGRCTVRATADPAVPPPREICQACPLGPACRVGAPTLRASAPRRRAPTG